MKHHGMYRTKAHTAWRNMRQRCLDQNIEFYDYYGGRGIKVCPEWETDFMQFYKDMGEPPSKKHTLERIDNDRDYCPDNCKWVLPVEQNHNQRMQKNNKSGFVGVRFVTRFGKWVAYLKHNRKQIHIGCFPSRAEAVAARDAYVIKNNLPHKLSGD